MHLVRFGRELFKHTFLVQTCILPDSPRLCVLNLNIKPHENVFQRVLIFRNSDVTQRQLSLFLLKTYFPLFNCDPLNFNPSVENPLNGFN